MKNETISYSYNENSNTRHLSRSKMRRLCVKYNNGAPREIAHAPYRQLINI